MDVSSESAERLGADTTQQRLLASYLPVALAAAGCAAAIAIVLIGHDLTSQRSAWERDKPVREQLMAENSTIEQSLAARGAQLAQLDAQLNALRQSASIAQSDFDKALAEKGKTEAARVATQAQLDGLRQQLDEGQKKLSGLKDDLRRGDSDLAILKDQQGKSQLSVQQLANDNSRLQGDTKQFDATIKFMAQQRDGLATEIDGRQTQLRQLKQEAAGQ